MSDRPFLHPLQTVVHPDESPTQMAPGLQPLQQQSGSDGHHMADYHLSGVNTGGVQSPSFGQLHPTMQSSSSSRSTFNVSHPPRPPAGGAELHGSADAELDSEAMGSANAITTIGHPPQHHHHHQQQQQQHGRFMQRHHHSNGLFVQF
jgi:hypothetical protein